jgi:hypothetical protein
VTSQQTGARRRPIGIREGDELGRGRGWSRANRPLDTQPGWRQAKRRREVGERDWRVYSWQSRG